MRVSNAIHKGSTVLNKVNDKHYSVVFNDGAKIIAICDDKKPEVEYDVSADGKVECVVQPVEIEQVTITPANAIAFRCVSYAPDENDYSESTKLVDGVLVVNGIPVQMGTLKAKRILGFLPGKVIFEREDAPQVCSFEPLRDKFTTLSDVDGDLSVLGVFPDALILAYKKEEEQEKEDGTKELVLMATGVIVVDDVGNAEKISAEKPFEEIFRVQRTMDKEFFLRRAGAKEYEILSNRRSEYSLTPSFFEGDILVATASYRNGIAVIGSDHFYVGTYNIPYDGQTLVDKGTTILVDLTVSKDTLSFSFANADATKVTTINVTVTKDRGYIVEEPKKLPDDVLE